MRRVDLLDAHRIVRLDRTFYLNEDVVHVARSLLGKVLVTCLNGERTAGIITETEAYAGITDRASHAFGGRRTPRNEAMYGIGGTAYVYLCYGIHHLFNVVTNREGVPHAVLIRGIVPLEGLEVMMRRRGADKLITKGPGTAAQALGIHVRHSGLDLLGDRIWIGSTDRAPHASAIKSAPRIGVDYAGPDASLPYRFFIAPSRPMPNTPWP